jgi:hypothetical protein
MTTTSRGGRGGGGNVDDDNEDKDDVEHEHERDHIPDGTSATPGEVQALRRAMLLTRNLLNVFSPVYSRQSSLDDYVGGASTSSSTTTTRVIR